MDLGQLRKKWALLTEIGIFLVGVVTGTIILPLTSQRLSGVIRVEPLAVFLVSVLGVLFLVLLAKWNKKAHLAGWWITTATLLIAFSASLYWYISLSNSLTCSYAGEKVPIGQEYTDKGSRYVKEFPEKNCETLLMDFAGVATDVWKADSINNTRMLILGSYLLNVAVASLLIVSAVQVSVLQRRKK